MGNGSGVKGDDADISDLFGVNIADPLSADDIEKAAATAIASFGSPTQIYLPQNMIKPFFMMSGIKYSAHPQYEGTPWAERDRLTKREHAVAKLHVFLYKLKALRNTDEAAFEDIKNLTVKRLKRARWAQYTQKKVQSSP